MFGNFSKHSDDLWYLPEKLLFFGDVHAAVADSSFPFVNEVFFFTDTSMIGDPIPFPNPTEIYLWSYIRFICWLDLILSNDCTLIST